MDAASGDNDLLFKLGFEPHPQTGSRLDALVKQVETAYDRITKLDNEIGQRLTTTVERVGSKTAADTTTVTETARTTAATEARVVQVEREIDSLKEKTKTLVDVLKGETEYTDRMKSLSEARRVAVEAEAAQMRSYFDRLKTDLNDIAAYQSKHGHEAFNRLAAGGKPANSEDSAAQMAIVRAATAGEQAAALQAKSEQEAAKVRQKAAREAERAAEEETAFRQRIWMRELSMKKAQEAEIRKEEQESAKARLSASKIAQKEAEEETAFKQRIWMRELAMKKAQEAEKRAAEHKSTLDQIDAYAKEQAAHEKAVESIAKGRAGLVEGFGKTAGAVGKLSRGVVLFGLATGDDLDKVVKRLAAVQTAIDTIAGTGELIQGVSKIWESLRLITLGNVKAKQAEAAAGRVATSASAELQRALQQEALTAKQAATAHDMLGRSRNVSAASGAGPQPGGVPATGGGRRGATAGMIGGTAGAIVGGAAGFHAGQAAGGDTGAVVGGVAGSVIGGAAATIISQKLAGAAVWSTVGKAAAMALSAPFLKVGAAIAGVAFIGNQVRTLARDVGQNGLMGGSAKGSFNDTVGGSNLNPFGWIVAWGPKMEAMQAEERTTKMEHQAKIHKQEAEHNKKVAELRRKNAVELHKADIDARRRNLDTRISLTSSEKEKVSLNKQAESGAVGEVRNAQRLLAGVDRSSEDGKRYTDQLIEAQERLATVRERGIQLEIEARKESRRTTLEEIKNIEDLINKRLKDRKELQDNQKTAKEKFGALSEMDQRKTIAALDRARKDPTKLSKQDADLLRNNIDTKESKDLLSKRDQAAADKMGYSSKVDRGETAKRTEELDKELRKSFRQLTEKSGQAEAELRKAADKGLKDKDSSVEIVDRRAFELKADILERDFIDKIMGEINKLMSDRDEVMQKKLNEAMADQIAKENDSNRKAVAALKKANAG